MKIAHPPFARYVGREEVIARARHRNPPADVFLKGVGNYSGKNLDQILDSAEAMENGDDRRRRHDR